jgi:hypothetical protein
MRLQERLLDESAASPTLLERYAAALRDDPTVGLYNLYGLPTEQIHLT